MKVQPSFSFSVSGKFQCVFPDGPHGFLPQRNYVLGPLANSPFYGFHEVLVKRWTGIQGRPVSSGGLCHVSYFRRVIRLLLSKGSASWARNTSRQQGPCKQVDCPRTLPTQVEDCASLCWEMCLVWLGTWNKRGNGPVPAAHTSALEKGFLASKRQAGQRDSRWEPMPVRNPSMAARSLLR